MMSQHTVSHTWHYELFVVADKHAEVMGAVFKTMMYLNSDVMITGPITKAEPRWERTSWSSSLTHKVGDLRIKSGLLIIEHSLLLTLHRHLSPCQINKRVSAASYGGCDAMGNALLYIIG